MHTLSTELVRGHSVTFTLPHIMHTWSTYCVRCICDFNTPPHCAAHRALQRIRRKCCQREKEAQKSCELCEFWIQMTGQTRTLKVKYSALVDKCTMISCALLLVQLVDCFASLNQVKTCLQVVWNHGSQVPCLPRHSSQRVLFVGVLAVLVAIKHATLLMTF